MNATENSVKKILGLLFVGLIGLWLIFTLVFGSGYILNPGMARGYGGGPMYMGAGVSLGTTGAISLLLMFLIKVLFVLFISGLVIGFALTVKKYVFTEEDLQKIRGIFSGQRLATLTKKCRVCEKEQNEDWKVCPFCGTERTTIIA